ncbi:MAG: aldehyde dehydrogenase family protein [Thalassotalea sp.]
MNYDQLVQLHKDYFKSQATKNVTWRKQQLKQLFKLVTDNESRLTDALYNDLSKPYQEVWMAEISYITSDIQHTLKNIDGWAKKRRVSTSLVALPATSFIQPEPLGCVLIIGAWNYPLQLVLAPLIAVITAGNCAVLKPSELAPHTSSLIAELIPQYMDNKAVSVVEGGINDTTALLTCTFDHIMYTGNGTVAKIVMAAAAKTLTPVTLELGGKSPVYVDDSANITITAQRIAWGKWLNAGQTCVAPDYILTTESNVGKLIDALILQIKTMFSTEPEHSQSYGRIINQRHCQRIISYLTNQNIVYGGDYSLKDKYISPTIILNPSTDSPLLAEEIFGPILPIITVESINQAIAYITDRDKPLAAYLFSKNKEQEKKWLTDISAGSIAINDVMMFNAVADLPFGGVGASGIGQYSGKIGFDNFSHLKAVIKRPFIKDLAIRFAPFSARKVKILKWLR